MKKLLSLLLCAALVLGLAACGGTSSGAGMKAIASAPMAAAPREEAAMEMADGASNSLTGSGSGSTTLPEGRKWIITMDMNVETEDLDGLRAKLDQKISTLGGYVEDQNIHNGSSFASKRYRSANLTVRIPDEKVDSFTGEMSEMANVVSQNLRREDITLKYVATSSRVTALETEEARLLELLAEADNMTDLLEIEARLTDVRYELENYASQLRLYDNQIDYATIYLYIEEVQEYTPAKDPTFFERIRNTFSDSLEGLGDGIVNIIVFLVGNSPYLLTFGVIAFAVFKFLKRSGKLRFRKKNKTTE